MSLSLEQEAELIPLAERAFDLIINLVMKEEDQELDREFHEVVKQISAISPFTSKLYLSWYERLPKLRERTLEYVKDNVDLPCQSKRLN